MRTIEQIKADIFAIDDEAAQAGFYDTPVELLSPRYLELIKELRDAARAELAALKGADNAE